MNPFLDTISFALLCFALLVYNLLYYFQEKAFHGFAFILGFLMLKLPHFSISKCHQIRHKYMHAFTLGNWPLCSISLPQTIDQLWVVVGALESSI